MFIYYINDLQLPSFLHKDKSPQSLFKMIVFSDFYCCLDKTK